MENYSLHVYALLNIVLQLKKMTGIAVICMYHIVGKLAVEFTSVVFEI